MEKETQKQNKSPFYLRSMVSSGLIILFFVGVILGYYGMLYTQTRERIALRCELSAEAGAREIDKYLSTGTDTLRMICYTLDNMIKDGRSQAEIVDYLKNESVAVENINAEYANGLYGYINGEYIDGMGWKPEENFVPTERPWYVEGRSSIGRVAVVGPYLDVRTDTMMITLSKTLCDAVSVVSMDSSMDHMQGIAKELAEQDGLETEVILDRRYQVIAHSDPAELGKNYLLEDSGFGSALVQGMRASAQRSFSLHYDGADYVVDTVPVTNDWVCVSVFDATSVFSQLRNTLIFTILATVVVVVILLYYMISSNRKTRMTEELTEDLSQARTDLQKRDSELGEISRVAYRDALTSVGSKAAYNRLVSELAPQFGPDGEPLAVVMMDVNNLKTVNDSYGHDAGDIYLRGCSRLICEVFKHSPVFRLGGDEFVAVLRGEDYVDRTTLMERLTREFAAVSARTDGSPWERYSAAVGIAERRDGDADLDQVLKRADEAMYAAKQAFKAKHDELKKA